MTTTAVTTGTRRRPPLRASTTELASAVVFVAAWRQRLWLIAVAMAAAAIVVTVSEYVAERRLAARAATWALFAPAGMARVSDLERALTADLACVAAGDHGIIKAGRAHVQQIRDPWLRSLAGERLDNACRLLDGDALPVVRPRLAGWLARREVLVATWVSAAFLVLAVAWTRRELLLAPLTLTVAMVAVGSHEARRRTAVVDALCREAITAPVRGRAFMPEAAVVAALATITSGRPSVLCRARTQVSTAGVPERAVALDRLTLAASTAGRHERSATRRVTIWWAVCCAGIAAMALL